VTTAGRPPDRPSSRPLKGVRIVELATWFASPSGNRLLSDLGADAIKIETRDGDPIRPLPDPCEGATGGKRSIAIDLKAPGATGIVLRLLESADVFQHNRRPGAAERLSLDDQSVRSRSSDIIYA